MFTCDWCISIHFVCFCVSRFVACDRPVSGNNRLLFLEDFSDHSYSCLLPSTKSPLIIAISFAILEQSRVILSFVFAGQARRVLCIVISINSASTQIIDGTEKPIRSLQRAARCNEFAINQTTQKNTSQNFPTQKNLQMDNFKPHKILRSSLSLDIWSTAPPPLPPTCTKFLPRLESSCLFINSNIIKRLNG